MAFRTEPVTPIGNHLKFGKHIPYKIGGIINFLYLMMPYVKKIIIQKDKFELDEFAVQMLL